MHQKPYSVLTPFFGDTYYLLLMSTPTKKILPGSLWWRCWGHVIFEAHPHILWRVKKQNHHHHRAVRQTPRWILCIISFGLSVWTRSQIATRLSQATLLLCWLFYSFVVVLVGHPCHVAPQHERRRCRIDPWPRQDLGTTLWHSYSTWYVTFNRLSLLVCLDDAFFSLPRVGSVGLLPCVGLFWRCHFRWLSLSVLLLHCVWNYLFVTVASHLICLFFLLFHPLFLLLFLLLGLTREKKTKKNIL